jgi:iron complex transport system substrate-binding protein
MSAQAWSNIGGAVCALALSTAAATWHIADNSSGATFNARNSGAETEPDSTDSLVDHTGTRVPFKNYRRIASSSTLADQLLRTLCEPERIIAVSRHSARDPRHGYLFGGKPELDAATDIETIIALKPDLLFVSTIVDPRLVTRLREAGIIVYDLGPMLGLKTLLPNILEVAKLVGRPQLGERMASSFRQRMARVAADIPASQRRRGMYLSALGGHLFGGTRGTSFHDVLSAAGVLDCAAPKFTDWPEFTPEQILELDPELIVTNARMAEAICGHSALAKLRACTASHSIVELDAETLGDAGLGMLEAAEKIRGTVYGQH